MAAVYRFMSSALYIRSNKIKSCFFRQTGRFRAGPATPTSAPLAPTDALGCGGALPAPHPRPRPVARAAISRTRKNSVSFAGPSLACPSPPHCVPRIIFQKSSAQNKTPRLSPTQTRSCDPHALRAPAHENMRSIEHGSGRHKQLAFSGSAALLLSTGHPLRERVGALARAEGGEQVVGRVSLAKNLCPGCPHKVPHIMI